MIHLYARKLAIVCLMSLTAVTAFAETKLAVMNYQAVLFNSKAANDATLILRASIEPDQKKTLEIMIAVLEGRRDLKHLDRVGK